jgi:16S rRNA (uracil1498-N3)-methyltransferase
VTPPGPARGGGAVGGGWADEARRAAAHVFVADLAHPELDGDDGHHLRRVLRLRAGEAVSTSDGAGRWRACTFDGSAVLEPAGPVVEVPTPAPPVTVGFAVPKGDRAEWAVQKLTEIGVDRIIPLVTAHGVVRWDDARAARQRDRLAAVARQAAMQSRRVTLPTVDPPTALAALRDALAGVGGGVALAEPGGAAPSLARPVILVGPEGGWSAEELAGGTATVALAATVLRTETAAVVAGTLLVALRAGLVAPAGTGPGPIHPK